MPVSEATPAFYRGAPYPDSQLLVRNEDGTPNSQTNPAARGSVVTVAVNGLGAYTVAGDSIVPATPLPLTINGVEAPGADTNLLAIPGMKGLVTCKKVYVPGSEVDGPTSVRVQLLWQNSPDWMPSSMWNQVMAMPPEAPHHPVTKSCMAAFAPQCWYLS